MYCYLCACVLTDGRKHKKSFGHYNVVSSSGSEHKLTLKLSKSKGEEERKGVFKFTN